MILREALSVPKNGFDRISKDEFRAWKGGHAMAKSPYVEWNEKGKWGEVLFEVDVYERGEKNENGKFIKRKIEKFSLDQTNGNLFIDTDRSMIATKFFMLSFLRPMKTVIDTIYHVGMIGIFRAVRDYQKGKIEKREMQTKVIRSFVDIIRTPIYGIALTAIAMVGFVVSCFSDRGAFEMRDIQGRVENHLNWGKRSWESFSHTLAPCMQPKRNLACLGDSSNFENNVEELLIDVLLFLKERGFLIFANQVPASRSVA